MIINNGLLDICPLIFRDRHVKVNIFTKNLLYLLLNLVFLLNSPCHSVVCAKDPDLSLCLASPVITPFPTQSIADPVHFFLSVTVHPFAYFCLECHFCNTGLHALCQIYSDSLWTVFLLLYPCPFLSPSLSGNFLKPKAKHVVLLLTSFHRFSFAFRIKAKLFKMSFKVLHDLCNPLPSHLLHLSQYLHSVLLFMWASDLLTPCSLLPLNAIMVCLGQKHLSITHSPLLCSPNIY